MRLSKDGIPLPELDVEFSDLHRHRIYLYEISSAHCSRDAERWWCLRLGLTSIGLINALPWFHPYYNAACRIYINLDTINDISMFTSTLQLLIATLAPIGQSEVVLLDSGVIVELEWRSHNTSPHESVLYLEVIKRSSSYVEVTRLLPSEVEVLYRIMMAYGQKILSLRVTSPKTVLIT